MIWKLLRKNISAWQIAGYAVATFVGLTIVMLAIQFRADTASALESNENSSGVGLISKRNIVISKKVGLSSTIKGAAPVFSGDDISDIRRQPWAGEVHEFQSSDFGVWAGIDIGGRTMQTALFFESVPDGLIDIDSSVWTFDPSNPLIPIIISKEYLALYNFGFASTGQMPPVSEKALSSIPISVTITGNGERTTLPARIVGFSDWLNTVAVPQQFMDWAHRRFGSDEPVSPSRLVVEVADPSNPDLAAWLESRSYETAGPQADLSRATFFLNLISGSVAAVGALITLLALFILVLSLVLLVQKSRRAISGLLLLGYPTADVSRGYIRLVAVVNAAVLALSFLIMFAVRQVWLAGLERIDLPAGSMFASAAGGIGIMVAITVVDTLLIVRLVRRRFR